MDAHYILDTNIIVHLVRDNALGQWIGLRYRLMTVRPIPAYSIVSAGEVLSLAVRNNWGSDKLTHLEFLLDYFDCRFLDTRKLADDYAMLDTTARELGTKMGKNDLWIASAAYADKLTLLTTDRDFDALGSVLLQSDFIDPNAFGGN